MSRVGHTPRARAAQAAAALVVLALATTVVVSSGGWVGSTFPGFLLMQNRVVPSIGLEHWTGTRPPPVYQRQVVAVNGAPVAVTEEVYGRVAAEPPGHAFRYLVRDRTGDEERTIASMSFGVRDWVLLFGALLLNGVIFTGVGLAVWVLGLRVSTTIGASVFTLNIGLFCLTAMDLYGPGRFFRLHVTTEALFPATLLHLMLVFPLPRIYRWRRAVLAAIYLVDLGLVASYQWYLYEPQLYTHIHNLCMAAVAVAGIGMIASGVHAYVTGRSLLARKRLGVLAVGTVAGFALPAWLLLMSALAGGEFAINVATFTAFLFPVSLAYAALKHDLFELDAMLRRALGYVALSGLIGAIYAVVVLGVGLIAQGATLAHSPAFTLAFCLLFILGLNPLRDRVQRTVDRLYHRRTHDPQETLERTSAALAATFDLADITSLAVDTVCDALAVEHATLWLHTGDDRFAAVAARGVARPPGGTVAADHPLMARLRGVRRALSIHDFADVRLGAAERACAETLAALDVELVLPLERDRPVGFLALGPKKARTLYTLEDLNFLATLANQVAVAIRNAQAYRKIEELNVDLERKVVQRTSELAATNGELEESLRALERAYAELQRSQEKLVSAEKMATLGRLTAGIAHEVNTPLGAALNGLMIGEDLVKEYARSIADPEVGPDDQREIATELGDVLANVRTWTVKAAQYIRGIKALTRGLGDLQERSFEASGLIEDTLLLLHHRLRLAACRVEVNCPPGVTLWGDPGKLAQVLTNLLTNAIDACDGRPDGGAIGLRVSVEEDRVLIAVEDEGCGIAPEHRERVFDELFTTKPPGRGTGLGLSISRDIVSDCFGGRIAVTSTLGEGSRFTIELPRRDGAARADAESVARAAEDAATRRGG